MKPLISRIILVLFFCSMGECTSKKPKAVRRPELAASPVKKPATLLPTSPTTDSSPVAIASKGGGMAASTAAATPAIAATPTATVTAGRPVSSSVSGNKKLATQGKAKPLAQTANNHPTAKPLALGTNKDSTAGSGMTMSAKSPVRLDGGVELSNKPIDATSLASRHVDPMVNAAAVMAASGAPEPKYQKEVDDYLNRVRAKILANWRCPKEVASKQAAGEAQVSFKINLDGRIQNLKVSKSSGLRLLDEASLAGVRAVAPFPAIPKSYKWPLGFTCSFTCSLSM